jgi:hypothetical protein
MSNELHITMHHITMHYSMSIALGAQVVILGLAIAFGADPKLTTKNHVEQQQSFNARAVRLRGRVANEAGAPLAGVRVRVAIPAADMRFVDCTTGHKLLETKSDAKGDYYLNLSGITKLTTVSIDAVKPGYQRLVGTIMQGGEETRVALVPGLSAEASIKLSKPALYFAGIVVDGKGKPISGVQIVADADSDGASFGIERTATKSDGSFELFNYPTKPVASIDDAGKLAVTKGVVSFFHPDYVECSIGDVYTVARHQRSDLRILVADGRTLKGTLLDVTGKPAPNVMITAIRDDRTHRKATITDANGRFVLRGLADGPSLLIADALDIMQKSRVSLVLDKDQGDMTMQLHPIVLPADLRKYTVLGMQLTDLTPEVKSAYDINDQAGVLILDPGKNTGRLNIGEIAAGYRFSMVGEKPIASVREFLAQIIAETAGQTTDKCSVRVVYSFNSLKFDGNNTQTLMLSQNDIRQLHVVMDQLTAWEWNTIAELRNAGAQFKVKGAEQLGTRYKSGNGSRISLVILGKKWNGNEDDLRKISWLSILAGSHVLVLGQGRVTDRSLDNLRKWQPRIGVARISEASLGVIAETTKQSTGLQVDEVLPGSPAARAGIQDGDRILEFIGKPVHDSNTLRTLALRLKPGEMVDVKLLRDTKRFTVAVKAGEWE